MTDKPQERGRKRFSGSRRARIALYFIAFTVQIVVFTTIYISAYPVPGGMPISRPDQGAIPRLPLGTLSPGLEWLSLIRFS
ncbi:MAG TPA: hypothetical protein HA256_08455 [Methanoregulaceae archaeon]|nr:hypothetical protein [Methanoregulaceae archaeon]